MKKLLIGGQALVKLGSPRTTKDTDYLVNDISTTDAFTHDTANNVDYCNANGLEFFKEVWEMEEKRGAVSEMASPQALLELKCFSFAQNRLNGHFQKADDAEYDIKFLIRNCGATAPKIAKKHIHATAISYLTEYISTFGVEEEFGDNTQKELNEFESAIKSLHDDSSELKINQVKTLANNLLQKESIAIDNTVGMALRKLKRLKNIGITL